MAQLSQRPKPAPLYRHLWVNKPSQISALPRVKVGHVGHVSINSAWPNDAHGHKYPPDINDPPMTLVDEEVGCEAHRKRHQVHADVWQGREDAILWENLQITTFMWLQYVKLTAFNEKC